MNRYKKALNNITIDDNIEKKIMQKCTKKSFNRPILATCSILLLICLSITIVHAQDIKEIINSLGPKRSLGRQEIKTEQETVLLDEVHTLETKVDDLIVDYTDMSHIPPLADYISYLQVYDANSISDIEELHGVNLINFKNDKFEYGYYDITEDGHITIISIETKYNVSCDQVCDIMHKKGDKLIRVMARYYTKNYAKDIENDIYNNVEITKTFTNFLNVDTHGIAIGGHVDGDENENAYLDIFFNYDNVQYTIMAWNMDFEEVEEYLLNNLEQ